MKKIKFENGSEITVTKDTGLRGGKNLSEHNTKSNNPKL